MSKNNLKKMYVFSSEETKNIVEKYVQIEADRRECSLSKICVISARLSGTRS